MRWRSSDRFSDAVCLCPVPGREGPLKAPFVPLASGRQGLIHLKIAFKNRSWDQAPGAPARSHHLWDRVARGRRAQAKHVRASDLLFLASERFVFFGTPPSTLSLKPRGRLTEGAAWGLSLALAPWWFLSPRLAGPRTLHLRSVGRRMPGPRAVYCFTLL